MSSWREASDFKKNINMKRAYVLTGRVRRLVNKTSNFRGSNTEKQVEKALRALKEEERIASFFMTKKWSRHDRRGIDAVVFLLDGNEVKLQIKSSLKGIIEHKKKQENFKGRIPVVYGNYLPGETFDEYKERIFKALNE